MLKTSRVWRGDPIPFEPEFDVDALPLDGVAALELGRLDRLVARDLEARVSWSDWMRSRASAFSWAMRAASTASLARMSASSSARLRAISKPGSPRPCDALALDAPVLADPRRLDDLPRVDFRLLQRFVARDLAPAGSSSAPIDSAAVFFSCAIRAARVASSVAISASSMARRRAISWPCVSCWLTMRFSAIFFSWRDARGFDRLARGDVGLLDRPVARDFRRAHALLLRNAGRLGRLPRADAGLL